MHHEPGKQYPSSSSVGSDLLESLNPVRSSRSLCCDPFVAAACALITVFMVKSTHLDCVIASDAQERTTLALSDVVSAAVLVLVFILRHPKNYHFLGVSDSHGSRVRRLMRSGVVMALGFGVDVLVKMVNIWCDGPDLSLRDSAGHEYLELSDLASIVVAAFGPSLYSRYTCCCKDHGILMEGPDGALGSGQKAQGFFNDPSGTF